MGILFRNKKWMQEAKHITQVNPDFLIVGMGALMQNVFAKGA